MPDWDFERNIESMRIQALLATEYGMSLDAVLSGTGVSESMLNTPSVSVEAVQELRLIENIVAGLKAVPFLGIEAGKRYQFTTFGMLGFAVVSSKTQREALSIVLQHFKLTFGFTRFHVEDTEQHTNLYIEDEQIPEKLRYYVVERDIACLMSIQKDLCENFSFVEGLSFRHSQPSSTKQYEDICGAVPIFNAPHNKVVFNRSALEYPSSQYNASACEVAQEHCRQLLDRKNYQSGFTAKIRNIIAADVANTPKMEEIAKKLHMTPRTLHRKLDAQGSSFVKLRDEVRKSLADEFLFDLGMSVEQIADRLGYAEATTFINAYKRWHGMTPHARRRTK